MASRHGGGLAHTVWAWGSILCLLWAGAHPVIFPDKRQGIPRPLALQTLGPSWALWG